MTQWHGGKGSTPRKKNDLQAYADNWDRIFGNKSKLSHDERGFDIINDIVFINSYFTIGFILFL